MLTIPNCLHVSPAQNFFSLFFKICSVIKKYKVCFFHWRGSIFSLCSPLFGWFFLLQLFTCICPIVGISRHFRRSSTFQAYHACALLSLFPRARPALQCRKRPSESPHPPCPSFRRGCSTPFMQLAEHLTALRTWCKHLLHVRWNLKRAPSRHCSHGMTL